MNITHSDKTVPLEPPLLEPGEPPPYELVNPDGKAPCLLICEHAANRIPRKLNNLGLTEQALRQHTAWDIGCDYVTRRLSMILDAPALVGTYSRLVVDLNRRLDHPTAFVTHAEDVPVPGNMNMSEEERDLRIKEVYDPFHKKADELVRNFTSRDVIPAIISVHSFSSVFYQQNRPWEIGILWLRDPRLPEPVMAYFRDKGYKVGDNEPYDARILRGTVNNRYADVRGLPNILLEIRNDLIEAEEKGEEWAEMLGDCFKKLLQNETIHRYYDGPDMPHDPERERRYFDEIIKKAKRGE